MMAVELPEEKLSNFGVLSVENRGGESYLTDFVEKPAPGSAPSKLANISKYILSGAAREYVKAIEPDSKSGEYYLPEAVVAAAKDRTVLVHTITGEYLDAGNPASWLHANRVVAGDL